MKAFAAFIFLIQAAASFEDYPYTDHKIVGGMETTIENFPYQVSVRIYDRHICGGSIIDNTTILTAAHCVYKMNHSFYSVRVGSSQHNTGRIHLVKEVRMNPSYNPQIIDNDLAILKLSIPLRLDEKIQPIELQCPTEDIPEGTTAFVSGWGVTAEGSHKIPETLRMVDVNVISNSACNSYYGHGKITSHMLCARTLYHDSCQGDSGGPLAASGKLIGVVSWGYGCARPRYPGVYANVADMHDWIMKNM